MKDLDKAISINPKLPIAYLNRALVYRITGKHSEAQQDENRVADLESNSRNEI